MTTAEAETEGAARRNIAATPAPALGCRTEPRKNWMSEDAINELWAIAGRSTDKLQTVRADIGAPDDLPLVKWGCWSDVC